MERTIRYEGRPWRVWVTPAQLSDGSDSGLELVFVEERAQGRKLTWPVGHELLRCLSRDALELDERMLREALRGAMQAEPEPEGGEGGIPDAE